MDVAGDGYLVSGGQKLGPSRAHPAAGRARQVCAGQQAGGFLDDFILSCLKSSPPVPLSKGEKQPFLQTLPFSVFFLL